MSQLAIHGGSPAVAAGAITETWPIVDEADIEAVSNSLRTGNLSWINTKDVPALEERWANYVGSKYCIAVNSGTAALHAAVVAAGVEPGDEVIVPALSFLASASAVIHHQGLPVFADVDPRTYTLDPTKLEQHITDRTKAIIAVHLHGLPADMDPIIEIAHRHGVKVIEDNAQAPGAIYKGKQAGNVGDMGTYSIMAGKNLATAGEGGLFTTNDSDLRDRADMVKMFGEKVVKGQERDYNAMTMGWNYRFSSILAAFTLSQLDRFDDYIARVQAGADRLRACFDAIPGLEAPHVPAGSTHVYHHFRFRVKPEEAGLDLDAGVMRKALDNVMAAEGVPLIHYQTRPLPGQHLFQNKQGYGRGCPWSCGHNPRDIRYDIHDYPQTLDVIRSTMLVGKRLCMASFMEPANVDLYASAFEKVFANLDEFVRYAKSIEYREPWEGEVVLF